MDKFMIIICETTYTFKLLKPLILLNYLNHLNFCQFETNPAQMGLIQYKTAS